MKNPFDFDKEKKQGNASSALEKQLQQIKKLRTALAKAEKKRDWDKVQKLERRLEEASQNADEALIIRLAQAHWDTMPPKERDIYLHRPANITDFRFTVSQAQFGHDEDNPDNAAPFDS